MDTLADVKPTPSSPNHTHPTPTPNPFFFPNPNPNPNHTNPDPTPTTTTTTTLSAQNASQISLPSELSEVSLWLMVYVIPVIFSFGIFGNTVSFVVFLSEKMRRVSTNVYLAALSASNGVFLVAVAISWTDMVGLKLMHFNGLCQSAVYLTYCSGFLSVWLVVCITVENFVINFFLHKASKHCTVRRALSFVVLLSVSGLLLYDIAIWTTGVVRVDFRNGSESPKYCTTYAEYRSVMEVFTLLDVGLTLIVPSVIIVSLVVPTCVKNICRHSRPSSSSHTGSAAAGSRIADGTGSGAALSSGSVLLSRKERALVRVTRLLCVIIVSFVVLTAPDHLNKLRLLFVSRGGGGAADTATPSDVFVSFIIQVFYHLSFSVNFVYFLVWGKNFRDRFCCLFVAFYRVLGRCRTKLCRI